MSVGLDGGILSYQDQTNPGKGLGLIKQGQSGPIATFRIMYSRSGYKIHVLYVVCVHLSRGGHFY